MYEALKPYDSFHYWERLVSSLPPARRVLSELERWIDAPPAPDTVADSCVVARIPGSLHYTPETRRVLGSSGQISRGWMGEGILISDDRPLVWPGQTLWRLHSGEFRVSGIPPHLRVLAVAEIRADAMLRGDL